MSAFLGRFRWLFMPLGLFALVAMGVHAAADAVDERILWLVDRMDRLLEVEQRRTVARAIALVWELATDAVLALPLLGYSEDRAGWSASFRRLLRRPTPTAVLHPLATLVFSLAGACAVGRRVQGTLYLSSHVTLAENIAGPAAQIAALLAATGVMVALGLRAVLATLEREVGLCTQTPSPRTRRRLAWTVVVLPLAVAAAHNATPIVSFFR